MTDMARAAIHADLVGHDTKVRKRHGGTSTTFFLEKEPLRPGLVYTIGGNFSLSILHCIFLLDSLSLSLSIEKNHTFGVGSFREYNC